MKRWLRLLITSAGRRGELLQCFRNDAAALGIDLEIIACDLRPDWSPACRLADVRIAVPPVTEPEYIGALLDICCSCEISLIVPIGRASCRERVGQSVEIKVVHVILK